MKVKLGISNHHVHLTKEDYEYLFQDEPLNIRNKLYQPNQFASDKTVTIKGPKNTISNVRVVGPLRDYTQVEISKTDSYILGINPPVKDSGDLKEAKEITIINNNRQLTRKACIIATRHIHITKEEQEKYNLPKIVKIQVNGEKPAIIENVKLKVSPNSKLELHLDTDDANANLLEQGIELEIIKE